MPATARCEGLATQNHTAHTTTSEHGLHQQKMMSPAEPHTQNQSECVQFRCPRLPIIHRSRKAIHHHLSPYAMSRQTSHMVGKPQNISPPVIMERNKAATQARTHANDTNPSESSCGAWLIRSSKCASPSTVFPGCR